jgi:hypothetical protein
VLPGFAAAAALVCSLEGRPCLAVTGPGSAGWGADGEPDSTTTAIAELARSLGVGLALQIWGTEGRFDSFEDHVELLNAHLQVAQGNTEVRLDPVPIDYSPTADLLSAAGPVIAWDEAINI